MRINEISIQNYKCFHNTKIEGFERVNLIGGKNNSGKTVLLEALHLNYEPSFENLLLHSQLRGEKVELSEKPWAGLFYKNNTSAKIELKSNKLNAIVEKNFTTDEDIFEGYDIAVIKKDIYKLRITRKTKINIYEEILHNLEQLLALKTTQNSFITPSEPFNSEQLARAYNKAEDKGVENEVLDFLKIIDSSIHAISVSVQGQAHLRVKKNGQGVVPLTALGDAAKKIVHIILSVLNGDDKVIFIDEIENGIHYTAHQEFWKLLFTMAQQLDVQVFATTHSLEMIKAFEAVASKEYADEAAYFELFRHGKTQEIVAKKYNMETLNYKLERNLELRGE